MSIADYLFGGASWSIVYLGVAAALLLAYRIFATPDTRRFLVATLCAVLWYLLYGSPLGELEHYGLHSVGMLRHVFLLMVLPPLLLLLPPVNAWKWVPALTRPRALVGCWLLGALAMWLGHYAEAAHLSAVTARPVCGIVTAAGGWWADVPPQFLAVLLVLSGVLFALPVFHGIRERRLSAPVSVVYLFLACASCTLLGIWVTFSAASASAAPLIALGSNGLYPLLPSPRADQELAGMLMWVPGCVLYASTSAVLLLEWFGEFEGRTVIINNRLSK